MALVIFCSSPLRAIFNSSVSLRGRCPKGKERRNWDERVTREKIGRGRIFLPRSLGDSRKYPYLYHGRLLEFPKGSGGSLNWNSEGMGGYLRLEIQRHGGFHRWDF